MKNFKRMGAMAAAVAAALSLGACAYSPTTAYPTATVPVATTPVYTTTTAPVYTTTAPVGTEWGRVTNVEFIPAGTAIGASHNGILGAVVGAVVGGVVGNQIGGGSGRDVATVLGAGAGAYAGNRIARNAEGVSTAPGYRVTIQTDNGGWRAFEVPNGSDLRVGERVRIENGVIYKM